MAQRTIENIERIEAKFSFDSQLADIKGKLQLEHERKRFNSVIRMAKALRLNPEAIKELELKSNSIKKYIRLEEERIGA